MKVYLCVGTAKLVMEEMTTLVKVCSKLKEYLTLACWQSSSTALLYYYFLGSKMIYTVWFRFLSKIFFSIASICSSLHVVSYKIISTFRILYILDITNIRTFLLLCSRSLGIALETFHSLVFFLWTVLECFQKM